MVKKEIEIDGRKVPFKASAMTPILYRRINGRDMFKDMSRLADELPTEGQGEEGKKQDISVEDLSIFENIAYCMAKHADPDIPPLEEWFDQFNVFSIYLVLPELIDLWRVNQMTEAEAKKKQSQLQGR